MKQKKIETRKVGFGRPSAVATRRPAQTTSRPERPEDAIRGKMNAPNATNKKGGPPAKRCLARSGFLGRWNRKSVQEVSKLIIFWITFLAIQFS
jgi:hypothetical protein